MMTLTLDGITYNVIREKEFTLGAAEGFPNPVTRTEITLKRPRGKRFYHVVRYERGNYSSVV